MNIITVIPLTRAKVAETLVYFTASEAPVGAIVAVPLRSKTIHAIVAETRAAEDIKLEIKKAPYEIRKLSRIKAAAFLPVPFVEAAKKLAHYYAGNTGAVIDALVAETLLEEASKIEPPETPQGLALSRRLNLDALTFAVQGDDEDRMSSWRSLIRQEFARKKSVAFYAPTVEDAENITAALEKGIEGYIFTLHASLGRKKILAAWKEIAKSAHPMAVVATASFALLPRSDIDTVVIERENSRGWISQKAPYMDLRRALETLAHQSGQAVHLADSMLRTETLRRLDIHEINKGSPFKWRSVSLAKDSLVDMTRKEKETKPKFRVISAELEELIRRNREESAHLFAFVTRRGLSPVTVCNDCEIIVSCGNCGAPVVLHASKNPFGQPEAGGASGGRNFFMCHVCGEMRSADEACKNCGGSNLAMLGVGIDRAEEEIKSLFPAADIFKIDSDSTATPKQVAEELERFKAKPGGILLGTELALTHLKEKVDYCAVVSMDSLFALPDFRVAEKIMYAIVRLRSLATKAVLVQTRRPKERVFGYGLKGDLSGFYRETLAERKEFDYPPFSTMVKVTVEGKKEAIAQEMANIKKLVDPFETDVFPAFTATSRGNSAIHGLIRVESHLWPNSELIAKLKSLPPSVGVRVDPESLL